MGLTRIVFVILATWNSLDIITGAQIKLSNNTTVIEYGRRYILECSVSGNIRSRAISFKHNTLDICKLRVSKTNDRIDRTSCETFYNTSSAYNCLCIAYYSDVSVYRITIKSFNEVDATQWWCVAEMSSSNEADRLSNIVNLFYVTLSGNVTTFDADGVNSVTFTCETSNMTGSVTFTWINKTIEGSTYIENNLIVSKNGSTYRQELKFIPHWYQHGNTIACKVLDVSTNITAMSNSEILDLIYPPLKSPVMKQITNQETPLSSEITIQEGAMLNLSCEVTGGKPRVSTVTIRCDGINSTFYSVVGDRVTGYLSLTVRRNLHNHACQCSATHETGRYHFTSNVTIRVNLTDAEGVTVGHEFNSSNKILKVICEVKGYPDIYTFSSFTHFWGEHRIRELPGQHVSPNKYVLTVQNATYADSGRYQCDVSNGVQGPNKIKLQTNFTLVAIGDKPIFGDEEQNQTVSAVLGTTVVLERKIFSKSNITLPTWTNGQGENFTAEISSTTVTLRIYNTTVADDGYSVKLTISNLSNDDQGIYKLAVCNINGCDQFYTTLKVVVSEPVTLDPILIPAASGAAGFVVLLVIVIVIICVIKKRRNSQTNKTDNKDDDYNSVNRTNAQRETDINDDGYTVIHDDKLQKEPAMVDNELYFVSRNARKQKPKPEADINDDEHASVNQKDKQEEPATEDDLDLMNRVWMLNQKTPAPCIQW
ncbi:uncharacterized protein LOC121386882 isoform X2 [Gigantopelta aegis]|uniref:uncharacterized protein LOC121386882 isoform X2 n=1 Tax=Gigantopelta aegis TaxID=1735272 RepID=UPI001B88C034|nr:uncharacterized protein LOC121386882 isoform X2 [Gigantopelta aegis]